MSGEQMQVAGVDGCEAGWVVWTKRDKQHFVYTVSTLTELSFDDYEIVAIDMPIGLLDRPTKGGRIAEKLVRSMLPRSRKSSVFSAPSRAALPHLNDYPRACAASRKASPEKIAISLQCFHIMSKIQEIDRLLKCQPSLRDKIRETHPEYAFALLNGDEGLHRSKADPDGRSNRIKLLERAQFVKRSEIEEKLTTSRPKRCKLDDIVDAAVCCWVAEGIAKKEAHSVPPQREKDCSGIEMAIWGRGPLPPPIRLLL